ncbi:MAG: hypothetical protein JW884_14830 [Deltaproteobacteria bacterium]|nr:hypothetical protein [Deltaproteobacteria bacterium]
MNPALWYPIVPFTSLKMIDSLASSTCCFMKALPFADFYPLTRPHHLPISQNDGVINLTTDQTFTSPEPLIAAVKIINDHGASTAKTLLKKQSIHHTLSFPSPDHHIANLLRI